MILLLLFFWFCSFVVLSPYSLFGHQIWFFNYFSLTSWNFMASPCLHHFRIALLLLIIYFSLSCGYVFSSSFSIFFYFLDTLWRLMMEFSMTLLVICNIIRITYIIMVCVSIFDHIFILHVYMHHLVSLRNILCLSIHHFETFTF